MLYHKSIEEELGKVRGAVVPWNEGVVFKCPCNERQCYVSSPPHKSIKFDSEGILTIKPSLGYRAKGDKPENWCHFYITQGRFEMCNDAKCSWKGIEVRMNFQKRIRGWCRYWVVDGFTEDGLQHLVIGIGLVLLLWASWLTLHEALVGAAFFYIGREWRDFEIEYLRKRFARLAFLKPAAQWGYDQLRHSIWGWLSIVSVCLTAYFIF